VSEPSEVAERTEPVAPGVVHWRIHNGNIGGAISSSHAVDDVLIDPVRLADGAFAELPSPTAVLLTATCHQRAAWHYRRELGVEVWLPEGARPGDEEPDRRYDETDELPGGLRAVHTPGPEAHHHSFLLERVDGILFCSDLLMNDGSDGELELVPLEYHDDPDETMRSVERLLDLPFSILCLDHGAPMAHDPKAAIRRLLDRLR
jgi:glyoxylase-like metal-dependent hydrolase (beta-lactamase superfamily II)